MHKFGGLRGRGFGVWGLGSIELGGFSRFDSQSRSACMRCADNNTPKNATPLPKNDILQLHTSHKDPGTEALQISPRCKVPSFPHHLVRNNHALQGNREGAATSHRRSWKSIAQGATVLDARSCDRDHCVLRCRLLRIFNKTPRSCKR